MAILRIISDIHGNIGGRTGCYLDKIKGADYSIQLGDFGFHYPRDRFHRDKFNKYFEQFDINRHKVVLGNHDDYTYRVPNALGDFGVHKFENFEFFYIRGSISIDKHLRRENFSWWAEEQLTYTQGLECLKLYGEVKPNYVFSHDCPDAIALMMGYSGKFSDMKVCNTRTLLQACFDVWQPRYWFFGHYHRAFSTTFRETYFRCLAHDDLQEQRAETVDLTIGE